MSFFSVRKVCEEAEAKLAPVPGRNEVAGAKAKIERKRYGDGSHRLKVRVRDLPLPDGAALTLMIAGKVAAELHVKNGRARLDIESEDSKRVPPAEPGNAVELRVDNAVILSGKFYAD